MGDSSCLKRVIPVLQFLQRPRKNWRNWLKVGIDPQPSRLHHGVMIMPSYNHKKVQAWYEGFPMLDIEEYDKERYMNKQFSKSGTIDKSLLDE